MNGSFFDLTNLLALAPLAFASVDAALGGQPVRTVATLREEVLRWRDQYAPEYSDTECEYLVRWLNRNFYKL
ncbi:MAG: hypothetical protein ACT4P4_02265 [Betaproteobacteria bacterium]